MRKVSNSLLNSALEFANCDQEVLLHGIEIDLHDLVFEERVRLNCFYCGRYGRNWKCPPNLPDIDYPKMFLEYDYGALIYVRMKLTKANYNDVRINSSVFLHKGLLRMEKFFWDNNNATCLSFIGGGCKLCKNGCGEKHCNNPYESRSPVEATGINVVETAKKYDFHIDFPTNDYMIRCGLIVW